MWHSDGRAAPVIHQDVHEAVFIEVGQQTPHWRHSGWIIGNRIGRDSERLVSVADSGHWRDDDLVGPRLHLTKIVRQAISVQIGQRHARANG